MSERRRLLLAIANQFKWLPYSYENLYYGLVPTTIDSKTVKNKARVEKVYGNSVVENQQLTDNFDNASFWTKLRVAQTNNNNVATFVVNSNAYNFVAFYKSFPAGKLIKNHKYLISLKVKKTSGLANGFKINWEKANGGSSMVDVVQLNNPQLNTWYDLTAILTQEQENTSPTIAFGLNMLYSNISDIVVDSDAFEAKEPMVIDLTQMFPFDTPTTLLDTRVQALLNRDYIAYNTGEIKSVDIGEISSDSYNLSANEWEKGFINNGSDLSISYCVRTPSNKAIRVLPNVAYIYTINSSLYKYAFIVEYDENMTFIKQNGGTNNTSVSITTQANTKYVRLVFGDKDNTPISNIPSQDISETCLHITGTRTGYAPHQTFSPIPFKYQGAGVGTSHDTLERTDTEWVFTKNLDIDIPHNRYAVKDAYYSDLLSLEVYDVQKINNSFANASSWALGNVICDKTGFVRYQDRVNYSIIYNAIINTYLITFPSGTAEEDAKSFINSLTFRYQLATPQVIRIPRKRLGVYTFTGNETWNFSASRYWRITSENMPVNNVKAPSSTTTLANAYLSSLLTRTYNEVYNNTYEGFCINGNAEFGLYVAELVGKTSSEVAQFMAGKTIFYETNTEVEDMPFLLGIESGGTITTDSEVLPNVDFEMKAK